MADLIQTINDIEQALNDCDLYCNDCNKGRGEYCYPINRGIAENALELLKEQQAEIDRLKAQLAQYHKADTFLAVHGWQWKETTTESSTNPKDGEQK